MAGFLIFGGVVALILVLVLIGNKLERKRTETLRTVVAPRLGLDFVQTDETGIQAGFTGFDLFSHGRSKRVSNIAYGRLDDVEVILFDYEYVTGSGKNRQTHRQTIGFFQSDALALPEFVARPENIFHKIGQVFGYQDIDLPAHPEFSRRYVLRGVDESGIRDLFTPEVARFFESNPGLGIEAKADRFVLYRTRKRLKPEEWREWLDKGLAACAVLRAR
jgi:hypothetical protein